MGLNIGQFAGAGSVLRSVRDAGSSRASGQTQPFVAPVNPNGDETFLAKFRQSESPSARAGFNEGAIGGSPAAALNALTGTIDGVREHTPTLNDIRMEFRLQSEEARARFQEQFRTRALNSNDPPAIEIDTRPDTVEPTVVFNENQDISNEAVQASPEEIDTPDVTDDNGANRPEQVVNLSEREISFRPEPFDVTA